jgi:hypothetical protein
MKIRAYGSKALQTAVINLRGVSTNKTIIFLYITLMLDTVAECHLKLNYAVIKNLTKLLT